MGETHRTAGTVSTETFGTIRIVVIYFKVVAGNSIDLDQSICPDPEPAVTQLTDLGN
ncbi:hypothetical protein D3C86_1298220 [compost metagenome]